MIKLTKDDKEELLYALEYNNDTRGFPNNPNALHEQILDDYEKARSWDNAEVNYFPQTENALKVLRQENKELRKLRELVEKHHDSL